MEQLFAADESSVDSLKCSLVYVVDTLWCAHCSPAGDFKMSYSGCACKCTWTCVSVWQAHILLPSNSLVKLSSLLLHSILFIQHIKQSAHLYSSVTSALVVDHHGDALVFEQELYGELVGLLGPHWEQEIPRFCEVFPHYQLYGPPFQKCYCHTPSCAIACVTISP